MVACANRECTLHSLSLFHLCLIVQERESAKLQALGVQAETELRCFLTWAGGAQMALHGVAWPAHKAEELYYRDDECFAFCYM